MKIKPFKGRTIRPNQYVRVYRNLCNGLWSIKCTKSGLVLGHTDSVLLEDAIFHVSEPGRQRVIATKQKNVHAWVEGRIHDPKSEQPPLFDKIEVAYNPYRYDSFVRSSDKSPIYSAEAVYLKGTAVCTYTLRPKHIARLRSQHNNKGATTC